MPTAISLPSILWSMFIQLKLLEQFSRRNRLSCSSYTKKKYIIKKKLRYHIKNLCVRCHYLILMIFKFLKMYLMMKFYSIYENKNQEVKDKLIIKILTNQMKKESWKMKVFGPSFVADITCFTGSMENW